METGETRNDSKISVVIPAYNEQTTIIGLLDDIKNGTLLPYEIIVVDAGSTDDTAMLVATWAINNKDINLKLVRSEGTTYPGRARNLGVAEASGALIAFIDCGLIPNRTWLEDLVRPTKTENAEVVWCKCMPKCDTLWEEAFASIVEPKSTDASRRVVANSCITKELFNRIGGFREDLRAAEDLLYKRTIASQEVQESFSEALTWYTGYPTSYAKALKKWMLYAEFDVYAGTHRRKLFLSSLQAGIVLATPFVFRSIPKTTLFFVVLAILRTMVSVCGRGVRLNAIQWLYAVGIACSIDLGRGLGLANGLYKKHVRFRTKGVSHIDKGF